MWSRKQSRCVNWAGPYFLLKEILEVIVKESYEEVALKPEFLGSNPDFHWASVVCVSVCSADRHMEIMSTDHPIGTVCYNHMALRERVVIFSWALIERAADQSPGLWEGQ